MLHHGPPSPSATDNDDDAGLEQVFDSNTDFKAESSKGSDDCSRRSSCNTSVHAAFQIENCEVAGASMDSSSCKTELIPYDKTLIKILKEPKAKSKPFCGFQRRKRSELPGAANIFREEDAISEAGSDLSISSVASIQSLGGDNYGIMSSKSNGSYGLNQLFELPDVHGGRNRALDAQVQMRKLNRKLDLVRSENDSYAKMAKEIPDYKQELFHLKSANFDLLRENANLKSQLESAVTDLREQRESLNSAKQYDESFSMQSCDHSSILHNSKAQLRQAHDEIFCLKTELTKLKLDLRSRDDGLKRHQATVAALETSNHELSASNLKLAQKARELEANLQSCQRTRIAAEQSLSVLQSERESFVKSKNWYRDQMHSAQDSRNEIQQELIRAQSEVASKSTLVEKYKLEIFQSRQILEEEREKALQEKEELKRQLEELEVSFMNSEHSPSVVLSEDSGHDGDGLEEDLKIQLEVLKDDVRGKEAKMEILQRKLEEAIKMGESIRRDYDAANVKIERTKEKNEELLTNNALLGEQLLNNSSLIKELQEFKVNSDVMTTRLRDELNENRNALYRELDLTKELRNDLKVAKELVEKKESEIDSLHIELKHLKTDNERAKGDLKILKELQQENIQLKKQLLHHDSELLDENSKLKEAFAAADEAREELESALDELKRENGALKNEASNVQQCSVGRESLPEISLSESDSAPYHLTEKCEAREDAENKILELTKLVDSLKKQLESVDAVEKFSNESDDEGDDEDLRAIQAQKISRLECSLQVYQAEINRLSGKVHELEDHILTLEHKNGQLIMDSSQNGTLKSQIQKLHEEIAKDTALRKELLCGLELAKSSLYTELANLERNLQSEKEAHTETKNRLILQEHECSTLRVDRRSLRTGLETANLSIDKLKLELEAAKLHENTTDNRMVNNSEIEIARELAVTQEHLKDAQASSEDLRRQVSKLEDQLAEVNFHLKQKTSELTSLQSVVRVKDESYNSEVAELRSKCDNLRVEVVNLSRKVDRLSEEKNNYRAQVQDMNVALKNSLEQIKRLRSRPPNEENDGQQLDLMLSRKVGASNESLAQKQNLTNLHNCLATLKYEMAVLQRKLAPSTKNSPAKQPVQQEHPVIEVIETEESLVVIGNEEIIHDLL